MTSNRDEKSENPYESPERGASDAMDNGRRSSTPTQALVAVLVLIAVVGIMAALLLPPVTYSHP